MSAIGPLPGSHPTLDSVLASAHMGQGPAHPPERGLQTAHYGQSSAAQPAAAPQATPQND